MSETEDRAGADRPDEAGSGQAAAYPAAQAAVIEAEDGLLGRIDLIEAQPLHLRAAGFEQLHDELLTELQRGDQGAA